MLRSMNDLENYAIHATDGNIGHVKDFNFDDRAWVIRYFVVDAGAWLASRKVLISPMGVGHPNWGDKTIPVLITKDQVLNSPAFDHQQPISRQHEVEYLGYYSYPYYWGGSGLWGGETYPDRFTAGAGCFGNTPFILKPPRNESSDSDEETEPHLQHDLRSGMKLKGSRVIAADGDIGQVTDMLIDEETWAIRYLVVETANWWLGHQVLIAPQWIEGVNWADTTISIEMTRQEVKGSPHFDPNVQIDRQDEIGIHEHYGSPGYWVVEVEREEELPVD